MNQKNKSLPLIRRPWFAFLSSMRFAVALLSVLGVASVIGTVLQQSKPMADYLVKFGPFWTEIFKFLGLFDVYASPWFVLIMLFLVLSTGLCLWRNIPPFFREMRSFRLKATRQSLSLMKHSEDLNNRITPAVAARYLDVQGFQTRTVEREDGSVLVAAKKGAMNKWGYICAHLAIIVICTGGLIDSNLLLKIGMLSGRIVPEHNAQFAKDFKPESTLGLNNPSFRGNTFITEGQTASVAFLDVDNGASLMQDLPFTIKLNQFKVDFYNTGMPKNFASEVTVTDKATGEVQDVTIRVNHPFTLHGVTVYQASFEDGGSDVNFNAWNLNSGNAKSVPLSAVSQSAFPLNMGDKKYQLEFGKFTSTNVEHTGTEGQQGQGLAATLNDVRAVRQDKKFTNFGPSVIYRVRDEAGQAVEYQHFMVPMNQGGRYFYVTGWRTGLADEYEWMRVPADRESNPNTFMALREVLKNPQERARIVEESTRNVPAEQQAIFRDGLNKTFGLFANGGFIALNESMQRPIEGVESEKAQEFIYSTLIGMINMALDTALKNEGAPVWAADEARGQFIMDSMDAYTQMTRYPAPVLLQMTGFTERRMSVLQTTKSPGAALVYFGSVLLVLGTIFMFYVREKRAWVLFDGGRVRFAMAANRHERDLQKEFPQHTQRLAQLAEDLNHE